MKNIFKPMLYQTGMVQSILDGQKTITRRTKGLELINKNPENWKLIRDSKSVRNIYTFQMQEGLLTDTILVKCPWEIGDIIWVRETSLELNKEQMEGRASNIFYKTESLPIIDTYLKSLNYKWTPSMFMPRNYCRIFLKVIKIRTERLRDIFHYEAKAEGVKFIGTENQKIYFNYLTKEYCCNELYSFMTLWQKINGLDSWQNNPWVWVIEFEKIDKPDDFEI